MRGEIRRPLHGVPIAVKDLCWTQGVPTAAGMTIYKDFRPTEDATVVRKLYAAGAIILGKLQLTEGAWAEHHPQIPAPVNPWNAAHGRAPRPVVPGWRQPRDRPPRQLQRAVFRGQTLADMSGGTTKCSSGVDRQWRIGRPGRPPHSLD